MSILTLILLENYNNSKRHLAKLERLIGEIAYWKGITATCTIRGIERNLPIEEDKDYFDISDLRWERNN